MAKNTHAVALGRKGGSATTERKTKASRKNGTKGGRPRRPLTVFCVVSDTGGAHEAECVYSIWTTREAAEAELRRMETLYGKDSFGCNAGSLSITEVTTDTPSSDQYDWID